MMEEVHFAVIIFGALGCIAFQVYRSHGCIKKTEGKLDLLLNHFDLNR